MMNPLRTTRIEESAGRWSLAAEVDPDPSTPHGEWKATIGGERYGGRFLFVSPELGSEGILLQEAEVPDDPSLVLLIADLLLAVLEAEEYLPAGASLPGHGHTVTRRVLR